MIILAVIFVPRLIGGGDVAMPGQSQPDTSTPEKAAEAFVEAVRSEDADAVMRLSCIGNDGCIAEHGGGEATPEMITRAKENLRTAVPEMAKHLVDAEFQASREGSEPGSVEVPYTTPDMDRGHHRFLSFFPYEGRWYYFGSGGGARHDPEQRPSPR